MLDPDTVKGFPEFLPPESQKYEAIKKVIEKHLMLYGFLPTKTPSIEFDELMRSNTLQGEDEAVSDRFRLQDKAGRHLGLRYEFTFQLARIFKQNPTLKLPFRRYQIGLSFRDEPSAPGRYKEFTQADADIIGFSGLEADSECLALANDIMKDLKIKAEIHVNNKKLLNAILESVQVHQKQEVLKELDKIDKIGEDVVKSNLKKYADANQILSVFKLLEKDIDFFAKNLFDGSEDLMKLRDLAKVYGYTIKFNPFLVRGLAYYTGNIFEIRIPGSKHSLGGGGRYDNVVGRYINKQIPAVGISFGIERLMEHAKIDLANPKVIIISLDEDKEAIKLTQRLRKSGISCVLSNDKPGKALEYANSYSIKKAIFIGKEEIQKKKVKLKDLDSGEEKYLTEDQIIKKLL